MTPSHDLVATQLLKTMDWYRQDLREGRFMKREWILFHTDFILHYVDHIDDYSMQQKVIQQMIAIKFPYYLPTTIHPNNAHYVYNNKYLFGDPFDDPIDDPFDNYSDDPSDDPFDDPFNDPFNDPFDDNDKNANDSYGYNYPDDDDDSDDCFDNIFNATVDANLDDNFDNNFDDSSFDDRSFDDNSFDDNSFDDSSFDNSSFDNSNFDDTPQPPSSTTIMLTTMSTMLPTKLPSTITKTPPKQTQMPMIESIMKNNTFLPMTMIPTTSLHLIKTTQPSKALKLTTQNHVTTTLPIANNIPSSKPTNPSLSMPKIAVPLNKNPLGSPVNNSIQPLPGMSSTDATTLATPIAYIIAV